MSRERRAGPRTQRGVALITAMIIFALAIISFLGSTESEETRDCGCKILDKTYNSLYIQFERTGMSSDRPKKEQVVWLRLRNNTSCVVVLDMIGIYYRLVDGKAMNDPLDGEIIRLHYAIDTKSGRTYDIRTDQFGAISFLPGRSILFSVPSRYLKKNNAIAVPFQYLWEGFGIRGNPRCEVLFSPLSLPRGWEKKIS